jgi:hypothetical protein
MPNAICSSRDVNARQGKQWGASRDAGTIPLGPNWRVGSGASGGAFLAIARFTLGAYWRFATPPQRRQFLGMLDAHLVNVYCSRLQCLQQYHNDRLTIVSERPLGGGITLVATQLLWPSGQRPVELDWTVV